MERRDIENSIIRKFTDTISTDEEREIQKWKTESEENEKEFEAYRQLWEKSQDLVYSDELDVENALTVTKQRLNLGPKVRWLTVARQAAAVVVLAVSISAAFQFVSNKVRKNSNDLVYQEISATNGMRSRVDLSDGTVVWLNAGSTLRFPAVFDATAERRVELHGEGFFDVTKNPKKPFVVETPDLSIKVYGTAFNIFAYDQDSTMTVALVEGKIGLRKTGKEANELLTLQPNEVVQYNRNQNQLHQTKVANMKKYMAWRSGTLIFDNDPISDLTNRLSKWYNVDIQVEDKLLNNFRFTATFTNESLEQTLALLSLSSPMKYRVVQATQLADGSFSKRKVILTTK